MNFKICLIVSKHYAHTVIKAKGTMHAVCKHYIKIKPLYWDASLIFIYQHNVTYLINLALEKQYL